MHDESNLTEKQAQYLKKLDEPDKFYSTKKLGSFVEKGKTFFRLFTPNAEKVTLVVFDELENNKGKEFEMTKDNNCVWETSIDGERYGLYYSYKVKHSGMHAILCIDPYAKAVASLNTYFTPRKSIVVKENDYEWEGDTWIKRDWRDLIIYEMHIRDGILEDASREPRHQHSVREPGDRPSRPSESKGS